MSQKISRRTRRRRQAFRYSPAEQSRRDQSVLNWAAFLSAAIEIRSTGKMFATSVRIHPEHGVPVVAVATSNENVVGQIVFSPKIHDQKETNMSVAHSAASALDMARAMRGLCPNCGGGPVRNVWGMTNDDAECVACGTVFNSFERMREMDRLSAKGDQ